MMVLAGCSTVENFLGGDKVDYRSQAGKTTPLEVPPDLTQLARDGRFKPQSGTVSASTFRATGPATPAATTTNAVAATSATSVRIERQGQQRWLVSQQTPEQLWPVLREFWNSHGFTLAVDNPAVGLMETDYAEDRAKLPNDIIRRTIGRVLENLYSTGLRDKFRVRVERGASGTEIYLTHRGLEEVYTSTSRIEEKTVWQPRQPDAELEAEFLMRLMVRLGAKQDEAEAALKQQQAAAAAPTATVTASTGAPSGSVRPAAAPRARLLADAGVTVAEVDEGFDRAWRRVGVALDRGGFTVEDRDRSAGLYFVRWVDPKSVGADDGFFAKLFSKSSASSAAVQRYRIEVKASGDKTRVAVLNSAGAADAGSGARNIAARLVEELK
ncbi:MAG: outer membrane protein assembly factor BamC [Aquabacterium sp.]